MPDRLHTRWGVLAALPVALALGTDEEAAPVLAHRGLCERDALRVGEQLVVPREALDVVAQVARGVRELCRRAMPRGQR